MIVFMIFFRVILPTANGADLDVEENSFLRWICPNRGDPRCILNIPIDIGKVTIPEEEYSSIKKEQGRSLPSSRGSLRSKLQPLTGRQYLVEDLKHLQRSLGSRHREIMKVSLPESINFTTYSARDLVHDIRSVQKQLRDVFPELDQFIRLMKMKYSNIDATFILQKDEKVDDRSFPSADDFSNLKTFSRILVIGEFKLADTDQLLEY